MTNDDLPPLPPVSFFVQAYNSDDMHAYATAARAPLLSEITMLKIEIEQLRAVARHYPESNERMKACIAYLRQSATSVIAYRRSDDYSRGVRAQAAYTLAILDGHAADGGGDEA